MFAVSRRQPSPQANKLNARTHIASAFSCFMACKILAVLGYQKQLNVFIFTCHKRVPERDQVSLSIQK